MSVVNRRNAALGWLTWLALKHVLKQTTKGAVPTVDRESKRPNKSAIALASVAAASVGALTFLKHRAAGGETDTAESDSA
jgi:hypothetical protein